MSYTVSVDQVEIACEKLVLIRGAIVAHFQALSDDVVPTEEAGSRLGLAIQKGLFEIEDMLEKFKENKSTGNNCNT